MIPTSNIDLISVGLTVAASLILAVVVWLNNRKSATSSAFLFFVLASISWSIVNYLSYQTSDPNFKLWSIRLVLLSATLQASAFFVLMKVFPEEKLEWPRLNKWILAASTLAVAIFTLSPYVFSRVNTDSSRIAQPVPELGIVIFGLFAVSLIVWGILILIQKIKNAATLAEKIPFWYLFIGLFMMFGLIILFEFIWTILFKDTRFIPFAATFTLPFIVATTYAIFRHHLLHIRTVAAEIFAALLSLAVIFELIFSSSLIELMVRLIICIIVLAVSILLITSVWREEEQKTELENLNHQIQAQKEKLEELSRFKTQLLSLASHQMKSPLAAIKGFSSLILQGQMGTADSQGQETIRKIAKSADNLVGLINTLLDLRKVEEGKMDYQFVKTDLSRLVQEIYDMLKPLADTKQLAFTFSSAGREIWVNADAEKLKQVIQNITDNAIKYTPKGFVKLELESDGTYATVSVTDSGVGMSTELIPQLFEEFVRDQRVKARILGTGLGLYIARKITEAHGGKIWATSPGEGQGSTFFLTLPEMKI